MILQWWPISCEWGRGVGRIRVTAASGLLPTESLEITLNRSANIVASTAKRLGDEVVSETYIDYNISMYKIRFYTKCSYLSEAIFSAQYIKWLYLVKVKLFTIYVLLFNT
jgi:hypothetical protein